MHKKTHARTQRRGRSGPGKSHKPQPMKTRTSAARVGPLATADELDVRLRFTASSRLYNASGGAAAKEWTPNAAYDVDPSLGSTETAGFDEYALLYSYYRVIGYRYKVEIVSRETDALAVYLFNTNTAITGTAYDVLTGNPYCKYGQLGYYTGSGAKIKFSGYVSCAHLLGSAAVETADSLRAVTTGVPTDLLYLTLAVQSNGTLANITNGISYIITLTMDVRFYGRRFDLTISAMEAVVSEIKRARLLNNLKKQKNIIAAPNEKSPKSASHAV